MEALGRYNKLGIRESLSRVSDYPSACNELSCLLRGVYNKAPKDLQAIMFQDTLTALRLLPEMRTRRGMIAANLLIQAAEATLQKQKRALAVTEFKHAVVAFKRCSKARQDQEGLAPLPQDLLVQIFGFLDMHSLVTVCLVCWSWNAAARDNKLWQFQYSLFFGNPGMGRESRKENCKASADPVDLILQARNRGSDSVTDIDWKDSFKQKYMGNPSWKATSNRVYCGHCRSVFWLTDVKFADLHASDAEIKPYKIKPLSPDRVVAYVQGNSSAWSASDSDSDSDESSFTEHRLPKLWAYPRLVGHR